MADERATKGGSSVAKDPGGSPGRLYAALEPCRSYSKGVAVRSNLGPECGNWRVPFSWVYVTFGLQRIAPVSGSYPRCEVAALIH